MKTKIFLSVGLFISIYGYGQTYSAPASAGTGGDDNVYLGEFAGSDPANTGASNVFVGFQAGLTNAGSGNTFLGSLTGTTNTTGRFNLFSGNGAGRFNTTGSDNTYLGMNSGMYANGEINTFVGRLSGQHCSSSYNSFYGAYSGVLVTGNFNVCMGYEAAHGYLGSENVVIGYRAGYASTGSKNVFIGKQAGYNESNNYRLYIANSSTTTPLIYGNFDSKELAFNANKVGIGPTFGSSFPTLTFPNAANYRLMVRGGILAEEVRIRLQADWADYVFSPDYTLLPLKNVEQYISKNGHLPNMPSATDVKDQGIEIGNIVKLQQEKIEELTLYLIRQEKEIDTLKQQNEQLKELKQQVEILLKKQ
jgi:hypothetical protein